MEPKHERSSLDMAELLKAAKSQQQERNKQVVENKAKQNNSGIKVNIQSDLASASHGDFVMTDDGVAGIVIDHAEEARKMQENDKIGKSLLELIDDNSLIIDANKYEPNYGEDAPEGYNPGEEYIKNNPYEDKTRRMKEIKDGFSNLTYGIEGLVEKGTREAVMVEEAMEKLRTGEIVLPTPEEYEKQKEEAKRRRKEKKNPDTKVKKEPIKEKEPVITEDDSDDIFEPRMADVSDNVVIKNDLDNLLSSLEDNSTNKSSEVIKDKEDKSNELLPNNDNSQTENVIIKKGVDDILSAIENETVETMEEKETPTVVEEQQNAPTPINLVELEQELEEDASNQSGEDSPQEEIKPEEVVTINVEKGEAETLMENLPIETYNKVVEAKVVKVNEVELKDIPTNTTRITDIAAYKRISRRRPSVKTAEVTERVLINSGFVITLKAATSLEMATIFKSPTSEEVDWEKEYSFCYEHTVGTSIGKISYNEFVAKVSPSDIETILNGIYEISETDTRKISIRCNADVGCGEVYDADVEIAKLPKLDSLSDESKERIKKIIAAKNSIDDSRRIVQESPTSIVKQIKLGDRILSIRTTTGHMMIERMDRVNDVAMTYGTLIALLILYVENIIITYKEREDAKEQSFLIDNVDLLCEELKHVPDADLEIIKTVVTDELVEYPTITYSIKGPVKCPHCGHVDNEIPCFISDLVFQKAQSVLG